MTLGQVNCSLVEVRSKGGAPSSSPIVDEWALSCPAGALIWKNNAVFINPAEDGRCSSKQSKQDTEPPDLIPMDSALIHGSIVLGELACRLNSGKKGCKSVIVDN